MLPVPRPLRTPPTVTDAGTLIDPSGGTATVPLTPALAVADLDLYGYQLATLFPRSSAYVPVDSLRMVARARAQAWLGRLRGVAQHRGMKHWLVDLANVAFRAGNDTLGLRLLDTRLAQLPAQQTNAVQRSFVLATAVNLLEGMVSQSTGVTHHFLAAEAYAAQLMALPAGRYATRSDSTDVLYRQLEAQIALIHMADALQVTTKVLAHAEPLLKRIQRLGMYERREVILSWYPYGEIAMALVSQSGGRARLDSLNTRLLSLGEWQSVDASPFVRATRDSNDAIQWRRTLQGRFDSFSLLGQRAPPIVAHAWLNTMDSVYKDSARTDTMMDGHIRVIAFGGIHSEILPVLERIHQQLPKTVEVLLVTQTDGAIGPDMLDPRDEVMWLSHYYEGKRHLTFPIAIWAGPKVLGSYDMLQPTPSPIPSAYRARWIRGVCVVDTKGIIRAYQDVRTRDEEAMLIRRINMLIADARLSTHPVLP